jgi:hypothetical protein
MHIRGVEETGEIELFLPVFPLRRFILLFPAHIRLLSIPKKKAP